MSAIFIIISFFVLILILGAVWGKIERTLKSQRASAVSIPDASLNDLKVSSGVAESILSGQFENDISMYRFYFNHFLMMHLDIKGKVALGSNQSAMDVMKDEMIKYGKYAVAMDGKSKDWPSSFATLLKADDIGGENGVIIRNAMIFSIAMCTVTTTQTTWMKDLIGGTSMMVGASNTKSPEEYEEYMRANHPRAAAIAEGAGHIESQKVAQAIVPMMGYFIDKGQAGSIKETKRQRGMRIFEEQKIGV